MSKESRIYMVCEDDETAKEAAIMFQRVSAALSAVDTFADKMSDLDEDAPNLDDLAAPLITRLTLTLMQIYPNARQMSVDVKSIGDFTVRTV